MLREHNARLLAASPAQHATELTVRSHHDHDWISIESAVGDTVLRTISSRLRTTALTVHVIDEKVTQFHYGRFEDGQAVRLLSYGGPGRDRSQWEEVEGHPEGWERRFFEPGQIALYRQWCPAEVDEVVAHDAIKPGLSIPKPCSLDVAAAIARSFELTWLPLESGGFPPAAQTEVIAGTPGGWTPPRHAPWWKFWER